MRSATLSRTRLARWPSSLRAIRSLAISTSRPGRDREGLSAADRVALVSERNRVRENLAVRAQMDKRCADRAKPREAL